MRGQGPRRGRSVAAQDVQALHVGVGHTELVGDDPVEQDDALLELATVVEVFRTDFPDARLAVPYGELRQSDVGGIMGGRLTALPVLLR